MIITNILPLFDIKDHWGDDKCSCHPIVKIENDKTTIIHKDFDLKYNLRLKFYNLTLNVGQLN